MKTNCVPSSQNRQTNCGSAYIFRLEFGVWNQEAQLLPGNIAAEAHFGQAVQVEWQPKQARRVGW